MMEEGPAGTRLDRGTRPRSRRGMGEVLKVSADSKPKAVAGALAAVLREKGSVELQAVGAGAVNQAVKAIAITRGFVAPNGIDLVAIPAFTKVQIEGEERTAIRFLVQAR
jgi:stage V sporulation protein S